MNNSSKTLVQRREALLVKSAALREQFIALPRPSPWNILGWSILRSGRVPSLRKDPVLWVSQVLRLVSKIRKSFRIISWISFALIVWEYVIIPLWPYAKTIFNRKTRKGR